MKVIYILGEGRSGSTVLDILLSNHKDVLGVGELWTFLADDETLTGACSCGAPYRECDFWKEVRRQYLAKINETDLPRIGNLRRRHDSFSRLPFKFFGFWGKDFKDYCRYTSTLFETLAEVSGKQFIVDSTKQVGRAINLVRCPKLDVYLIHLVRDGRGVLWSRLRDAEREPGGRRALRRKLWLYSIFAWTIKNMAGSWIGKLAKDKYVLVRYEDLVAEPGKELSRIGAVCGLDLQPLISHLESGHALQSSHQIGGNARARSSRRPIQLKLDEEWQVRLPMGQRTLFWLIAGPLAKRLGYARAPIKRDQQQA